MVFSPILRVGLMVVLTCVAAPAEAAAPPLPRPQISTPDKSSDAYLYKQIFALQAKANWQRADRLIGQLQDPILLGHVQFQRYMHPTGYRTKWMELRDWLEKYADHPEAGRIYRLALRRKPRRASMPTNPLPAADFVTQNKNSSPLFRSQTARRIKYKVTRLVRRERPTNALEYIQKKRQSQHLTPTEINFLKSFIARSYYIEGKIFKALELAIEATHNRRDVPLADWHAGLAAFRLGKIDIAINYFEKLAQNRFAGERLRAQAAYWAARGLHRRGEVVRAETHFRAAAGSGVHFYALLATQHIANGLVINWQRADNASDKRLGAHPAMRRAEALRAAEQNEWAQTELLFLQKRLSDSQARTLLSYTRDNNYPAVQLALVSRLEARKNNGLPLSLYEGVYPLPALADGHRQIDRALLFALIRQESRFKARAKSHAGARGLMQIMPQTAAFLSGNRRLAQRTGRDQLLNSDLNLKLGQKYLTMLLSPAYFNGNLILAIAAYNAGPGNMRRWRNQLRNVRDPLLFIESLPASETRNYVRKVMGNMWVYRLRLNQEATGHRILAAESWPLYRAQDKILPKPQPNRGQQH